MNKITKESVSASLVLIGPKFLKPEWASKWAKDRPTTGYCYLVSEILYHYIYTEAKPKVMRVNGGTHWFLVDNGVVVDWTGNQFDCEVPYEEGRGCGFFVGSVKTNRGKISKKSYELAKILEIV